LPGEDAVRGKAKTVEADLAKELLQCGPLGLTLGEGHGLLCRCSTLRLLCGLGFPIPDPVRLDSASRWAGVFDKLGQPGGLGRNVPVDGQWPSRVSSLVLLHNNPRWENPSEAGDPLYGDPASLPSLTMTVVEPFT